MRRYQVTLRKYGIGKPAYTELRGFCLQYPLKKQNREKWADDIRLIEETAEEVDEVLAPFIIKSVTEDIPYWVLAANDGIPAGEKVFSEKRRQFYYELAKKKKVVIKEGSI